MKILIVYDSYYGNNEKVAKAMSDALGAGNQVNAIHAGMLRPDHFKDVRLLIIGSPTRVFYPTKPIKKVITSLTRPTIENTPVALYDTRMDITKLQNKLLIKMQKKRVSAAANMQKLALKKGCRIVGQPAGFIVLDSEGPLREGELQKAGEWAKLAAGEIRD